MTPTETLSIRVALSFGEFSLDAGMDVGAEPVAVVGPNGCGKSTLLLAILGIRTPARGRIALGDRVLFDSDAGSECPTEDRHMAYLPQDFGLFPFLTAVANVEFAIGCGRAPVDRKQHHDRAMACLERFSIGHLAARRPHQLSGGQRQRVALARAIAAEPQALLLDEPTASLDVGARAEVRTLLQASIAELRIPTLIVTHDVGDITALAGRVAVMEAGRIVGCSGVEEAWRTPVNAFAAKVLARASDPQGTAAAREGLTHVLRSET